MRSFFAALAITSSLLVSPGWADETPFLLERKIPLGEVRGRIDHLAVDLARNRLFVAELENDTVAVIDLDAYKVMQVISGLSKPQGLGYHPPTDSLYVANGGDGTAAIFRGDDYRAITRIPLGKDRSSIQPAEARSPTSSSRRIPKAFSSIEARAAFSSTIRLTKPSSSSIAPRERQWRVGRRAAAAISPWP